VSHRGWLKECGVGGGEKMFGSMRIESVSVPVSDQEQAKSFYVDTLGFELLVDNTWREGMRWSEVAPEGSTTSLMLVTWQAGMLPGMHRVVVMDTDEIQTVHRELVSRGIDFELPPTETPRGTQAMFRDPDGNALLLWEHEVAQVRNVPAEGPAFGLVGEDSRRGRGVRPS
jgi:catechol 2,3-dioxygenase-like lactoylglutathione lyase family enzyme